VRFVDTNVLLYSISTDPSETTKRDIADAILVARDLVLSAQVLQEFYVQATRVTRSNHLEGEAAARLVDSYTRYPIVPLTSDLVSAAMAAQRRYRISYWDAAIIEAARAAGCSTLLSEDLASGRDYDGVRVTNLFV